MISRKVDLVYVISSVIAAVAFAVMLGAKAPLSQLAAGYGLMTSLVLGMLSLRYLFRDTGLAQNATLKQRLVVMVGALVFGGICLTLGIMASNMRFVDQIQIDAMFSIALGSVFVALLQIRDALILVVGSAQYSAVRRRLQQL